MSYKIMTLVGGALLLGSAAAQATIVDGSFSGTLVGAGTDSTGVFGAVGDLPDADAVTGTFVYDTSLLSQSIVGTQNTASGTGLGALTVTLTINGVSHTFTDNTSSSVTIDDSISELNLATADTAGTADETFALEADDALNPFITSTDLTQTFSTSDAFLSSLGTFFIDDTSPNALATGSFSITSISTTTGSNSVPEPVSMAVLAVGMAGIAGVRKRRGRG